MLKKLALLVANLIFLMHFVVAQDSTQIAQWETFKSRYGSNLKIKWNNLTKTPGVFYGQPIDLKYNGIKDSAAAENLALDLLRKNKDFLSLMLINWNYGKIISSLIIVLFPFDKDMRE